MTTKPDGGPAHPVPITADRDGYAHPKPDLRGMTLRDWFAGRAMQGELASQRGPSADDGGKNYDHDNLTVLVGWAYAVADAMIAARGGG